MMRIGMLWYDNSPVDTLAMKVQRAAAYYLGKYGQAPTLCMVHPSMLLDDISVNGITIKKHRSILPNHFWMGVE